MPMFAITGIKVPEHLARYSEIDEYASRDEAQYVLDSLHAFGVAGGEVIELEDTDLVDKPTEPLPDRASKM